MSAFVDRECFRFRSSMLAGSASVGMFNPLDTLRVRYQLVQGGVATPTATVREYAASVIRSEGLWRGLWRPGLSANVLAVACREPVRNGCYPLVRDSVTSWNGGDKSSSVMFASGYICGSVGYAICAPFFLAKTRLNAEAALVAARQPSNKYGGSLVGVLSTIVREEGVAALWKGSAVLVVRGGLLSAGQWLGYDGLKTAVKERDWLEDGTQLHVLASLMGGFMSATLASPADVVMTQWTTARQQGRQHATLLALIRDIYNVGGVAGFFRGWVPFFGRVAPLFAVLLPLHERLRLQMGLGYLD
eukprot:gene7726-35436_t